MHNSEPAPLNLLLPSSELPQDQTASQFHSFFYVSMCWLLPLCVQIKYSPVSKVVSGIFHDKDPANFPFKQAGETCSDKLRNMEKTYQKEYKRGRCHKAQMSVNGGVTQDDGAEVGQVPIGSQKPAGSQMPLSSFELNAALVSPSGVQAVEHPAHTGLKRKRSRTQSEPHIVNTSTLRSPDRQTAARTLKAAQNFIRVDR